MVLLQLGESVREVLLGHFGRAQLAEAFGVERQNEGVEGALEGGTVQDGAEAHLDGQ
jgi:hypothetical protein